MAELRSFIFLSRLQPQTMCYLGTWIRGSLPRSHVAAQVIEVAPGLDIEPLTDVAVKHADVKAGILVVERQFGYLEIHGGTDEVQAAASAVLGALGDRPRRQPPGDTRLQDHHHAGPAAGVPGEPEQDRLDGAGRGVAVRAGDAAGLVCDPGC